MNLGKSLLTEFTTLSFFTIGHWLPMVFQGEKKKFLKSSGQETHTSDHRESFLFSKLAVKAPEGVNSQQGALRFLCHTHTQTTARHKKKSPAAAIPPGGAQHGSLKPTNHIPQSPDAHWHQCSRSTKLREHRFLLSYISMALWFSQWQHNKISLRKYAKSSAPIYLITLCKPQRTHYSTKEPVARS